MKPTDKQTIITCPKCGADFPLTEAVLEPLKVELRKDYSTEYEKKLQDMKEVLRLKQEKKLKKTNIVTIKDYQGTSSRIQR